MFSISCRVGASPLRWKSPCGVSLPELRTASPQRITGQGSRWGLGNKDQRKMRDAPLLAQAWNKSRIEGAWGCRRECGTTMRDAVVALGETGGEHGTNPPLHSNSTHHASAMQAHQGCPRGMHTGHALRDNGAGSRRWSARRPYDPLFWLCGSGARGSSARIEGQRRSGARPHFQRSDLDGQIIPEPRSDAPVLWSWRRMIERTRVIWERRTK